MRSCVGLCAFLFCAALLAGEDWSGPFNIIPVSAPEMALEAVGSGTADGTKVSIGNPDATAENQKWIIRGTGDGFYLISAAYNPKLVLAASGGGTTNGTQLVLETESDKPWQLWAIKKNDNNSFSLLPKHAPEKGIDDLGGGAKPGCKIDIWEYHATDEHLQWVLKPLAGATVPDAAKGLSLLDIPKGTLKEFTFEQSAIFPGTTRACTVFIPAQYDGKTPACVYVRQDGYNAREKLMLETLIAAKEMPVTIGVFVRSGQLPGPSKEVFGRRNRCFEYDGVGDNYVRFLTEELLPYVAKTFDLKLSTSGNDRCIAGGSSGGISAFNAAWERPDAFSRVYAASGSFVAFRGGHEFPTLVRKFEAKPIRAFLTTGTHDMENCAGDWYLIDLEMEKALKFSGYDYVFKAIEGKHVVGMNENFPDAMRFLWKGWPEPVKAGESAPRVRDVIVPGQGWELVAEELIGARGPACNAKGEVFFIQAGEIKRIGLDGKIEVFVADAADANCLSVGAKGELYAASELTKKIMSYNAAGKGSVYAENISAKYICAMPNGGIYVTRMGAIRHQGLVFPNAVYFVKDGHTILADEGMAAHGIAYRPDQWLLAVADGASKWVYSHQIASDGKLINKERFFHLHVPDWLDNAGAQSLCYARENKLLVATNSGVQICADDGPTQVILPMPDRSWVEGLCFGGADLSTLYAFCGGKIWKRAMKLHGIGAFTPYVKVGGNPL